MYSHGCGKRLKNLLHRENSLPPLEVLRELQKQPDELCTWAREHMCFEDLDSAQVECVKRILREFPSLIDEKKTIPDVDPFVIALALAKGWKVVSSENPAGTSSRKRIPDVCAHYRLKCLTLLDLFRDRQWNF